MKLEDLPTPEQLEQLLKDFIKKNSSSIDKEDEESTENTTDSNSGKSTNSSSSSIDDLVTPPLDNESTLTAPANNSNNSVGEEPENAWDPYDGFKGLDDDFDLAYEAINEQKEKEEPQLQTTSKHEPDTESIDNINQPLEDQEENMPVHESHGEDFVEEPEIFDHPRYSDNNLDEDGDVTEGNAEDVPDNGSKDNSYDTDEDEEEEDDKEMSDREFQRLYENFLREELTSDDDDDDDEEDENEQEDDPVDEGDPLAELMSMTGLEDVKRAVNQQIYYNRIMKMRREAGKQIPKRLNHLLLTGNPGTGKTTVAKLIGRIYKKEGILGRGHLIETNRASLVGEFIGQSEKKTLDIIDDAKGGILFIDEIYALGERASDVTDNKDFGMKVLDTLMPILDKVDSDLVVIGAGYPNKISKFLKANPGLTSRFPTVLNFKDFTVEELKEIALNLLKKYDFVPSEEFLKGLDSLMAKALKVEDFGNARMVNTLINNFVIPNLCTRLALSEEPVTDVEKTSLVLAKDLPTIEQLFPLETKKRQMGFS